MFVLFLLLVSIFDGVVVGCIAALLITWMFGDKPAARIAKVLLGIAAGGGYSYWCIKLLVSDGSDVSTGFVLTVLFAPVVVFFVLRLLVYAFKKE